MTIARLNQRLQNGEAGVEERLVHTYQTDLLRLANAILDDPAEAEEAVQDALLAALTGLETYRGEAALRTWLFSITINTCRRRLRKRQARQRLSRALQTIFRMGAGPAHPEETYIRGETRTAVRRAVDALSEKQRLPVLLFYDHEFSVADIAAALDLPVGTVLSRLHKAREKLRVVLQDDLYPQIKEREDDGNPRSTS